MLDPDLMLTLEMYWYAAKELANIVFSIAIVYVLFVLIPGAFFLFARWLLR